MATTRHAAHFFSRRAALGISPGLAVLWARSGTHKLRNLVSSRRIFQLMVVLGVSTLAATLVIAKYWKINIFIVSMNWSHDQIGIEHLNRSSSIHPICLTELTSNVSSDSKIPMRKLAAKLRAYAALSTYLEHCKHENFDTVNVTMLQLKHSELERSLFPFLSTKSAIEWRDSFRRGRGLAICVGFAYLRFALMLLENLRMLNSTLPVEIFYRTGELQPSQINRLEAFGAKVIDIYTLVDMQLAAFSNDKYAIKPFALFFSSYSETVLIDADTLFFRKPELFFDNAGYAKTGTLFFLDRYYSKYQPTRGRIWFDTNMPQPISDRFKQTQMYRGLSGHLLESGVVLIDKRRNYIGALAACRIMTKYDNQAWFGEGDKEYFWLGFELLDQDYTIHPMRPGILGWLSVTPNKKSPEVCGNMFHPGDDGRPFWSNGGIIYKASHNTRPIKYEAFAIEGERDTLRVDSASCLEDVPVVLLNASELYITSELSNYWKRVY